MWLWITLIVLAWIACGIAAAGRLFASRQRSYPTVAEDGRSKDIRSAREAFLLGPIALLISPLYDTHGFIINDKGKRRYWKTTGLVSQTYVTIGDPSKSDLSKIIFGKRSGDVEINKEEFDS